MEEIKSPGGNTYRKSSQHFLQDLHLQSAESLEIDLMEKQEVNKEKPVEHIFKVDQQKKFRSKGLIIHNLNSTALKIEEMIQTLERGEYKSVILKAGQELLVHILKRFVICLGLTKHVSRDLSWEWPSLNDQSKLLHKF
jgi:hypothetical protein